MMHEAGVAMVPGGEDLEKQQKTMLDLVLQPLVIFSSAR